MNKIKVLEVNNIDLPGNRFNGYDMIQDITDNNLKIKQAVIIKKSNNDKVIKMLKNKNQQIIYGIFENVERKQSIHNVFSITTPALLKLPEYKEADIIHFHMFHNTKLSLYSLIQIATEKKVVISIHDPWFLTGRCVHFYDCNKWKTGCDKCPNLKSLFPLDKDNCSQLWKLKKYVFDNIDIDLVCSSDWMMDMAKATPILSNQKHYHKIPLGIDYKKFSSVSYEESRKKIGIDEDELVLFFRAQNEFKGTPYIVEAMKLLETNKKITLLTCDNTGLVDDLKGKYKIIELGCINDADMIYAMNACDIFLMPSIGESFGMMAIEAMACGKPVIVFNNSALPSVTHAPKCGYLVKNKDAKDLMNAIKYLCENENERFRRGELAKKIVQEEYGIEEYNTNLKKLYISVMERQHKVITPTKMKVNTKNEINFKAYLNKLTLKIFKNSKKIKQLLYYDIDNLKVNKTQPIRYDDMNIHHILEEYLIKVEEIARTKRHSVRKSRRFDKIIYYLLHDRKTLKTKILQKIRKKV